MASEEEDGVARKRKRKPSASTGPYILRPLVEDVPLSAEEDVTDIQITCVELWGQSAKPCYLFHSLGNSSSVHINQSLT